MRCFVLRMEKIVIYPASRLFYDKVLASVKSVLKNGNIDTVFLGIEDDEYPGTLPDRVKTIKIKGLEWFPRTGKNYRNDYAFTCLSRTALAKLFPEQTRILSLDADTLVVGDISELWDLDLTDYYLAGVPERQLSTERGYPYINMGMALFNLQKIRADKMDDQLIRDINQTKYLWYEQDCINENCKGHVLPIGSEYNWCWFSDQSVEPKIVHFAATPEWFSNEMVQRYYAMGWNEALHGTEAPRISYECDRQKDCCESPSCGYECTHTFEPSHAKNGTATEIDLARFKPLINGDQVIYAEQPIL